MSDRLARKIILLASLVAFLFAGPGGASAYVLCIGGDGHTAIELDHGGDCGRGEACPAPEDTPPHCGGSDEHGSPCTDIDHSFISAAPRDKAPVLIAAPGLAVPPLPLPSLRPTLALHPARLTASPPTNSILLVLRSTVIRC
jgi:hypothetical protein